VACPDVAIALKDGKVVGIDYMHCKGCGICSFECPTDPKSIEMKLETDVPLK
jgi:pyruvate ferredoxin oxidoreductase delta subunit